MIGLPYSDFGCLEPASQLIAQRVAEREPRLVELAERYPTEKELVAYFRQLPQVDDRGGRIKGPRVAACIPSQRAEIASEAPNCFERALDFIAIREMIDPTHTYQLGTIELNDGINDGLHTFPLIDGRPILIHPTITADDIELGLRLAAPGPVELTPREAIASTLALAKQEATPVRNGPSTIARARNSIERLIDDQGVRSVPDPSEVDGLGVVFAWAERAAHRYGPRALAIVRTTERALGEILDIVTAQSVQVQRRRNLNFQIGDHGFNTPDWLDRFALAVHHTGEGIGKVAGRAYLSYLGISPDLIDFVGKNLEDQGISDPLKNPPSLATFADRFPKRPAA